MKKLFTNVLTAVISLTIIILILGLFEKLALPKWPFVILLVVMVEVYHLSFDKYLWIFVSGLAGIIVGFSQVLFGFVMPENLALIFFLLLLVVFATLDVGKNVVVANILCMVNANIILNIPGIAARENILPVGGAYLLSAAIMGLICYLLTRAQKGAKA